MSGYLPDLASWALGGGAGNADDNANQEGEGQATATDPTPSLTEEEIRARRLARMMGTTAPAAPEPMQVDDGTKDSSPGANKQDDKMDIDSEPVVASPKPATSSRILRVTPSTASVVQEPEAKKMKSKTSTTPPDPARKLQKRKELLLKNVLQLSLKGTSTTALADNKIAMIDLNHTNITPQSITDILSTRLSMTDDGLNSGVISYLGQCYNRASKELKRYQEESRTSQPELEEILVEIQRQTVSFSASTLMVPDLFHRGKDAVEQLTKSLMAAGDMEKSITVGASSAKNSSFYHRLCEELLAQDEDSFETVVKGVVDVLCKSLQKLGSILDTSPLGSAVTVTSGLAALVSHKRVASVVTQMDNFLLPAPSSPVAQERITPPAPQLPRGATSQQEAFFRMMQHMSRGAQRPYLKRSGPALEKHTILGLAVRVGIPKDDPNVTSAYPTGNVAMDAVDQVCNHQKRQLQIYMQVVHQLIKSLIVAGAEPRKQVLQWVTDALLVNVGAMGSHPDPSKVSKYVTLINLSAIMLQLCDPFLGKDEKISKIDPGFVSSPADHGGIYATAGDDLVPRLGEANDQASEPYSPKNKFIPQCFFLAARCLSLGVVPLSFTHQNLVQAVNSLYFRAGRADDPQFQHHYNVQRAMEVTLFWDEMIHSTLRFCHTMATFLLRLEDKDLKCMPEAFVSDVCIILNFLSSPPYYGRPQMLAGHEFRSIFQLVVKLLSPAYAPLIRNYNLRAKLGDVLFDVFLPPGYDDDEDRHGRRDQVPEVVSRDPKTGQTYLLSDASAQETLAPSLLLLYGEVEHTGVYSKIGHRAKIASLLKYLWESREHRPTFRRITQDKDSFIKFANGIMNENNALISEAMEFLTAMKLAEDQMDDTQTWNSLPEEQRETITSRYDDHKKNLKRILPLCSKALKLLGVLNTDQEIRTLFLKEELMCSKLVAMLLHILTKLIGSRGLDLKVKNPEELEFRPKEMLRDLCAIFAIFIDHIEFQNECAKSGYYKADLMNKAVSTCQRLQLLTGQSLVAFMKMPELIAQAKETVAADEDLYADAPDEFMDPLMATFMKDPVFLPTSGNVVDRSTITQHLLNEQSDPFNRKELTMEMVKPAEDLKKAMTEWLQAKKGASS